MYVHNAMCYSESHQVNRTYSESAIVLWTIFLPHLLSLFQVKHGDMQMTMMGRKSLGCDDDCKSKIFFSFFLFRTFRMLLFAVE